MEELLYRIEAILRRTISPVDVKGEELNHIGEYIFDSRRQLLTFREQQISLTTKESELLELLFRHKNEILERNYALKEYLD